MTFEEIYAEYKKLRKPEEELQALIDLKDKFSFHDERVLKVLTPQANETLSLILGFAKLSGADPDKTTRDFIRDLINEINIYRKKLYKEYEASEREREIQKTLEEIKNKLSSQQIITNSDGKQKFIAEAASKLKKDFEVGTQKDACENLALFIRNNFADKRNPNKIDGMNLTRFIKKYWIELGLDKVVKNNKSFLQELREAYSALRSKN